MLEQNSKLFISVWSRKVLSSTQHFVWKTLLDRI